MTSLRSICLITVIRHINYSSYKKNLPNVITNDIIKIWENLWKCFYGHDLYIINKEIRCKLCCECLVLNDDTFHRLTYKNYRNNNIGFYREMDIGIYNNDFDLNKFNYEHYIGGYIPDIPLLKWIQCFNCKQNINSFNKITDDIKLICNICDHKIPFETLYLPMLVCYKISSLVKKMNTNTLT